MASKCEEEFDLESSSESEDSDSELQRAFASGKLKVGMNKPKIFVPRAQRESINNVAGIKQKLEQISQDLEWIERMDVTYKPIEKDTKNEANDDDSAIHDDFKREMKFYKQAQEAVFVAIPKLHKLGIPTKRPEDYFAEMLKTDDHMQRVRSKLLNRQQAMERSEKLRKLREIKKFGKKVQHDVLQKRQKEKKEMIESVRKYRKGKQDAPSFMKDEEFDIKTEKEQKYKPTKSNRRKGKDKKFGFGGKKRGIKRNSKKSSADTSSFDSRKHSKPAKTGGQGGKKRKAQRPGKSRRKNMKMKK